MLYDRKDVILNTDEPAFGSDDEKYMSWYFLQLKALGYVKAVLIHPFSYLLSEKVTHKVLVGIRKIEEADHTLLAQHVYTPDLLVIWDTKAENVFYELIAGKIVYKKNLIFKAFNRIINGEDVPVSVIEVKPKFDKHQTGNLASVNRKWVYDKFEDYVQMVNFISVFGSSFIPDRFFLTNISKDKRKLDKLGFKNIRTLGEYLDVQRD